MANTPIYLVLLKITYQGMYYKIKEAAYLNKMCCRHLSTTKDQNVANKELNVLNLFVRMSSEKASLSDFSACHTLSDFKIRH